MGKPRQSDVVAVAQFDLRLDVICQPHPTPAVSKPIYDVSELACSEQGKEDSLSMVAGSGDPDPLGRRYRELR